MDLATPFDIKHAFVTPVSDADAEFQKDVAAAKTAVKATVKSAVNTTVRTALLSIERVPSWYGENPFILSGYRPVFASAAPCFGSWRYFHNQSANIFTHLVPGLLALVVNAGFGGWFADRYPEASMADQAVFHVYLTMAALCFGVSATYHTMLCHSRSLADLWIRLDYASITLLILGSVVPQLYVCFYCEPTLLRAYLTMFCTVAALNVYSCINDRNGSKNWIMNRLVPSIAMSCGAIIPNVHAATIFPYEQLVKQSGLNYYYLEAIFLFAGVVLLATRFPECYFPGRFDYLGASHTLMHVLVVMGSACHFVGILSGFDWNYNNQRCSAAMV